MASSHSCTSERGGPFDHHWGVFSASANPIDQSLEKCLSIWTEPCPTVRRLDVRERFGAQPRPLFRQ
ncbi:MAG: hypothetical protein KME37_09550 [Candidatus Thiodiazotropha sp. (ex Codakia orbicularis)]|nr:hypothetical protein [Candidatus Thiodiazotropha sp. (ex Codakia orbicularis)]